MAVIMVVITEVETPLSSITEIVSIIITITETDLQLFRITGREGVMVPVPPTGREVEHLHPRGHLTRQIEEATDHPHLRVNLEAAQTGHLPQRAMQEHQTVHLRQRDNHPAFRLNHPGQVHMVEEVGLWVEVECEAAEVAGGGGK